MKKLQSELKNRILRYDGVSIVAPGEVPNLFMCGVQPSKIRVSHIDNDVRLFNENVIAAHRILAEDNSPISIPLKWDIPSSYLELNLEEHVIDLYERRISSLGYSADKLDASAERVALELIEIEKRGMTEFVKTVIFIVDTFKEAGIVWGVGRGSSCASYILFLLGLHLVDPIKFDISMDEFFHD